MRDARLSSVRGASEPDGDNPDPLALSTPLPLTLHPAAVYLSGLAPKSRRTMRHALNTIAQLLTNGACDAMTLDWSKLRYQHTAAIRAAFMDKYAPTTANRMLAALRRVLKEARRLKQIDPEDYDSAVDIKGIQHTPLLHGRALSEQEVVARIEARPTDPAPPGAADINGVQPAPLLRGRALSEQEVVALIEACLNDPTLTGLRDVAMISILLAGLRRSEGVALAFSAFAP